MLELIYDWNFFFVTTPFDCFSHLRINRFQS